MAKRYALVNKNICVSCGACENACPKNAIKVWKGCFACVNTQNCVGCGICAKVCPANAIEIKLNEVTK